MKPILILTLIAWSNAAKLDRTYLPPAGAATAGGSPGSLTAPFGSQSSGPSVQLQQGGQQGPQQTFGSQNNAYQSPGSTGGGSFEGSATPFGAQGPLSSSTQGQTGPSGPSYPSAGKPAVSGFPAQGRLSGGPGPSGSTQPGYNQGFVGGANYPSSGPVKNAGLSYPGQSAGPSGGVAPGAQSFGQQAYTQPQRPQAAQDQAAEILRYDNQIDGDSFSYSFETSNGISAEENGVATNGVQAQGGFAYTGDDGQRYSVTYTADENGYQPRGDHLPTPPPIPDEILRSIEENARAAAAGTQEGAYQEDFDSGSAQPYNDNIQRPGSSVPGSRQQYSQQQFPSQTPQQPGGSSRQYGAPSGPSGQYNQGPTGTPQFSRVTGSSQQYNVQPQGAFTPSGPQSQTDQGSSGYNYDRPSQGPSSQYNQAARPQGPGAPFQFPKPAGSSQEYRPSGSAGVGPGARPSVQQFSQGPSGTQLSDSPQSVPITPGFRDNQQFGPRSGVSQGGSQPGQYTSSGPSEQYRQGPQTPSAQRPASSGGQYSLSSPSEQYRQGPQTPLAQRPASAGMTASQQPSSAPYQYNAPVSTAGSQQNGSGVFNAASNRPFNTNAGAPSTQGGGQTFGGPRQPPSFSPEEGYKY